MNMLGAKFDRASTKPDAVPQRAADHLVKALRRDRAIGERQAAL